MLKDEACIFCQIVDKKIQSQILFENDTILAFLDIFPISNGHTIVIPKNHYNNLEDIPVDELTDVFKIVKKISSKIYEKLKIDGYNILQNNFKAAGQVINHFHVHIIPRRREDGKFQLLIPREQSKEEELNKTLKTIIE
ncbi:MAG: HIT family protein [Candidatus Lokiarchaeota archaeon]|nr:HIT family protein [Candidatus Lokiarchaeota archaeon]